jgi:hypothetical protein
MNLKNIFDTLIDSIESHHTLGYIWKGLYETKLIRPSAHLGNVDTRTEMKTKIARTNLDDTKAREALRISRVDLSEIYRIKQNRANKVFYLTLMTIGASIGLIITGAIIAFIEKQQANLGFFTSVSSMLPGLIGALAYTFYRNEKNDLMLVEKDIIKISKSESFLEMLQYISDKDQESEAYENFRKQMFKADTPVKKILILSANPEDTDRLRLDKEIREIEEGLNLSEWREQFHIQSKWAVRYKDLRRALMKYKPHFVHFAGHGEDGRLMVESDEGLAVPISTKALSGLFEICSDHVECVILNACYSAQQADVINKHINYVIGMPGKINDQAAIEFAVGFYDALGGGDTVERAFKYGYNAVEQVFPNLPEDLMPVLKKGGRY